jgi:hypothetical protein
MSDTRSTRWLIGVAFVPVRSHRGIGRHQLRETTIIDSLRRNWTEEDRRTHAKWMRVIAVFYGCVALCVSGLVVLTRPSSVAPNEARDRESWSAGLQRERMDHNVDTSWKAR